MKTYELTAEFQHPASPKSTRLMRVRRKSKTLLTAVEAVKEFAFAEAGPTERIVFLGIRPIS